MVSGRGVPGPMAAAEAMVRAWAATMTALSMPTQREGRVTVGGEFALLRLRHLDVNGETRLYGLMLHSHSRLDRLGFLDRRVLVVLGKT
jgi:hypothetical protein